MDQATVVREQIDGAARLLATLSHSGLALVGACWARTTDDGRWRLYLVTPAVENADPRPSYRIVRAAIQGMDGEWGHSLERIDPFDVFLLAPSEALAVGIMGHYRRFPDEYPTWHHGSVLGEVSIEGAYIYPAKLFAPQPAAAG